jgi:hypothetical protein
MRRYRFTIPRWQFFNHKLTSTLLSSVTSLVRHFAAPTAAVLFNDLQDRFFRV